MYNMNEWLSQAIEVTANFIRWMFLLLVAIGMILLIMVMVYAVIKSIVKDVGKKEE